jgi:hypothetical protein
MIIHERGTARGGDHIPGAGGKKKPLRKKVAADPSRGFRLQDKLQAIYRKDCAIPIPFIPVSYISPGHMTKMGNRDGTYDIYFNYFSFLCFLVLFF